MFRCDRGTVVGACISSFISPPPLSLSLCHAQVYPQAVHTKLLSHPALPLQIATYYSTVDVMEYVLDLYPEVRERGEREEREGK